MRMPAIFLAHGAPPLLDDPPWMAELAAWAREMPRPRAILVISAHWEAAPLAIGATQPVPLIYDFYGFPDRFYKLAYPSPGAPELAARVRGLIAGTVDQPQRGLDHGAYIPLMCMYPEADIPVLQISIPSLEASSQLAIGRALAPLRDEGVLIIGSGFITHNLRALGLRQTPAWASDFDSWVGDAVARGNVDALVDYKHAAPGVRESLPTHEHFVPLLAAVGAGGGDRVTFPITGFWWNGPMTKRSVQLG